MEDDAGHHEAALRALEDLATDPRLLEQHRIHAVRAHLLERAGELEGAIVWYKKAAELTASVPERDYLSKRAARLRDRRG